IPACSWPPTATSKNCRERRSRPTRARRYSSASSTTSTPSRLAEKSHPESRNGRHPAPRVGAEAEGGKRIGIDPRDPLRTEIRPKSLGSRTQGGRRRYVLDFAPRFGEVGTRSAERPDEQRHADVGEVA